MDKRGLAYGKALYSCLEESELSSYTEYCEALLRLLKKTPEAMDLFASPKVNKAEKKKVLGQLTKAVKLPTLTDFLFVMADNNDLKELSDSLESFLDLAYKALGIYQGTVYSASKMKEEDVAKLAQALEKKLGAAVRLHNKIDSSLLGGYKVALGEKTYDYTLKSQLNALRTRLKGGQ